MIIDGKKTAAELREELKKKITELKSKYNSVPGDAVLYNGTEVRHWREPLNCGPDQYYHQLFLHYVNADGKYCQHAFDR